MSQQKENDVPSEEAMKLYWEISSNNTFPTVYRNIGTYLCAFHSLGKAYESIPRDEMLKRLEVMTEKNNASRLIAHELLAHYKKIDGKIYDARKSCNVVINDTNNPETAIVDRCRALIATLPEVMVTPEPKLEVPPASASASVAPVTEEKK